MHIFLCCLTFFRLLGNPSNKLWMDGGQQDGPYHGTDEWGGGGENEKDKIGLSTCCCWSLPPGVGVDRRDV